MTDTVEKAGRREWIGLAVLALPCLLYSMDLTVLNLAVPQLTADLRPSATQLLWIVDIYGFLVAGSLITMGTLGDRIGRRRLLLTGAVAFGAASVLAAFSTTAEMLIFARALLGLAAATLAPSTLSLLRNMFLDPVERTFAIGVWIASFSAGGAIGPLVGGLLLNWFWWGSVFLIAVPIMVLLLALGPYLLPEYKDPDAGKLDLASAALSLASVLAVIFGLKGMAAEGFGWASVAAILAGLALGLVFVRRQGRLAEPFIDLRLFRSPAFSASLAVNILAFFVAFAAFLTIAQYLQLVVGLSPLAAGLYSLPSGIAFVAGSLLTPRIAGRFRPAVVITAGLLTAAAGFALFTQVGGKNDVAVIVAAYVIFSIGLAPVFTMTTDLIVGTVPPSKAGMASGLAETSTEFGGALGIAVMGSIATVIYRRAMEGAVPAVVPADIANAARETLGGAVSVADALPPEVAATLLDLGRAAFTDGVQLTAGISALVALGTAVLVLVLLRRQGGDAAAGEIAPSSAAG